LLTDDVVAESLSATAGAIRVRGVVAEPAALQRCAAEPEIERGWRDRLKAAMA
jgi:hypothetical protein